MSRFLVIFSAAAALAAPLALSAPAPASARPVHPCAMNPPHNSCFAERMILCRSGVIDAGLTCHEFHDLAPTLGSGGAGPTTPAPVGVLAPSFERATPRIHNPADWGALNPQPIPPVDRRGLNPQPIPPFVR